MTTMKEIAERAGVSSATVSKIINGNDAHISEKTRMRVLKIIKEKNYIPNAVAKGLKTNKSNTIGFILPDIRNPFFPDIARGIEEAAEDYHFAVIFCDTDNDPKREMTAFNFLRSKMVDGIIFTKTLKESSFDYYLKYNLPIVVVDRKIDTNVRNVGKIFVDTQAAFFDSTMALIRKGCKDIGFISTESYSEDARYYGYLEALRAEGLKHDEMLVHYGDYSVETGMEGMKKILAYKKPDGVVCGDDLIAIGAMDMAKSEGLHIPRDIKIIGFDDILMSRYLSPALTTIKQPAYEMGKAAANMLIRNILYGTPLETEKLDYEFIERQSI